MIFIDSTRPVRFRKKMLRRWSPWRAARPVFIETLILAARVLHRGFFEIQIGGGPFDGLRTGHAPKCPAMPRFRKMTRRDLPKSPGISRFGKTVSTRFPIVSTGCQRIPGTASLECLVLSHRCAREKWTKPSLCGGRGFCRRSRGEWDTPASVGV